MLNWAKQFNIFCLLDSNQYNLVPNQYEVLLGAGCLSSCHPFLVPFEEVDAFIQAGKWTFGHLSYDLGFTFQNSAASKKSKLNFPLFYFFRPQIVVYIIGGRLCIEAPNESEVYEQIMASSSAKEEAQSPVLIQQKLTHEQYLQKIQALQGHIQKGDCYEINFCQEFFAEDVQLSAAAAFQALKSASPTPFSALYKLDDQYLACASPERFLTKSGNKLLSQPMKGTAKRQQAPAADKEAAEALYNSQKDRSENVMVVDLVRNDLSMICQPGSVKVDALYEIYSFPAVHQMVSTISGTLKENVSFTGIIKAMFPMGSMTGAPKKRVMQLIEHYEESSRGLFSGSVGYISPNGDFDFNVIIRSLLYNAQNRYLSYQVGSGITAYSNAEREWEECLLKGSAIKKVLTGAST